MKTRTGFVSNSSSSSFIIAIDVDEDSSCPFCKRHDFNIIDRIRLIGQRDVCDDTRLRSEGAQDVIDYINWLDAEEVTTITAVIKDYADRGFKIAYIDIGYHDDSLNNEFESLRTRGKLVVIKDLN
jgi:hypothetical protein